MHFISIRAVACRCARRRIFRSAKNPTTSGQDSKLCQLFQFFHALLDVCAFGLGGGVQAETFAAEGRGDAAVNHRAADVRINREARERTGKADEVLSLT